MKGRPATREGLPAFENPTAGRDGTAPGSSHHPQGVPNRDPHHPQGEKDKVPAERRCPLWAAGCGGDSDVRQPGGTPLGCGRQRPAMPVPEPGALRPLARALLAVAAEVHAARRDLPGAGRRPGERALRMGNRGLVQGLRSGVRSVVHSPATQERTGSGCASPQVNGAAPPPVVNPDSMGDCA